jgi:uncharacterized protein YciI
MANHHILFYDYVENIVERRAPHREEHLGVVRAEREAGHVVMGGALGDPPHTAAIVFKGVDRDHIEAFAKNDPYVKAGLVTAYRIEPWNVVV